MYMYVISEAKLILIAFTAWYTDTNTSINIIYIARLTNLFPGVLTNVKTRDGIDEF